MIPSNETYYSSSISTDFHCDGHLTGNSPITLVCVNRDCLLPPFICQDYERCGCFGKHGNHTTIPFETAKLLTDAPPNIDSKVLQSIKSMGILLKTMRVRLERL